MILPLLVSTIFTLLALLHVYWALGGKAGLAGAIPTLEGKPAFQPGRIATLAVAAALCACALLVAALAGWWNPPVSLGILTKIGYALAALFLLRAIGDFNHVGLFKSKRDSRFAKLDTLYYSPLCLGIALGVWVLARAG